MGDERLQTISVKISEETYERLKRYAEEHGESVSDVLRRLIDGVLAGGEQPSPPPGPSPGPGPAPQPGPALPAELLELPGKVQQILAYEEVLIANGQKTTILKNWLIPELKQVKKRIVPVTSLFSTHAF